MIYPKRKIIKRGDNLVLFMAGSRQVCIYIRVLIRDMGPIGIWMSIKELKHKQNVLIPMTREEAREIGQVLLDFGNREEVE